MVGSEPADMAKNKKKKRKSFSLNIRAPYQRDTAYNKREKKEEKWQKWRQMNTETERAS